MKLLKGAPQFLLSIGLGVLIIQAKADTHNNFGEHYCPSIKPKQDLIVECRLPTGGLLQNCSRPMPPNTVAAYKCPKFYKPSRDLAMYSRNEMKCSTRGEWSRVQNFNEFVCTLDCGNPVVRHKPLIVFGTETKRQSWPWHALIFRTDLPSKKYTYICGGSLLELSYIVSAGHCVTDISGRQLPPTSFVVVLGGVSSEFEANIEEENAQIFNIKNIWIPSEYNVKDFQSDISILKLESVAVPSEYVSPVCFPYANTEEKEAYMRLQLSPGNEGEIVGFGLDEHKKLSEVLRHTKLPIRTPKDCFDSISKIPSNSQFCAGTTEGPTICNGDSGGGLTMVEVYSTTKRYFVQGIVSHGHGTRNGDVCKNMVVFTKVHKYSDWVSEVFENAIKNSNSESSLQISNSPYKKVENIRKSDSIKTTTDSTHPELPSIGNRCSCAPNISLPSDKILLLSSLKWAKPSESSKIETTTKYAKILTTAVATTNRNVIQSTTVKIHVGCPNLEKNPGTDISCMDPDTENVFSCNNAGSPFGTKALYRCSKYWKPKIKGISSASRICRPNGQWSTFEPEMFDCIVDCGIEAGHIGDIIAGRFKCPASTGLFHENPVGSGNYELFCHGTLIGNSRRALITAGHCARREFMKNGNWKIVAMIGKYHRFIEYNDDKVQKRNIIDIDVHEGYDELKFKSDVAIMWMDRPIDINEQVRPMCLPKSETRLGEYGRLIWGKPVNSQLQRMVGKAFLKSPSLSVNICKGIRNATVKINERQAKIARNCISPSSGLSTCDVGGGGCIVTRDYTSARWQVEGIVSPATVGQNGEECFAGGDAVFIRLGYFRTWMDRILSQKDF